MIDTLKYAQGLEAAGVDRRVAEAQARLLAEVLQDQLVTRADLQAEIRPLRVRLGINTALLFALGGGFGGGLWAVWSQIAGVERELGRLAGLLAGGG